MSKKCDCPGRGVYDRGYGKRVEAWAATELAATQALQNLLPGAKADAATKQAAALQRALNDGDNACNPGTGRCKKCEAWFRAPDLGAPWTAVGALAPYNQWLARGGYEWTIEVDCKCLQPQCAVVLVAGGTVVEDALEPLRGLRDQRLAKSAAGRRYLTLVDKHTDELIVLLRESDLLETARALLSELVGYLPPAKGKGKPVAPATIQNVDKALTQFSAKASPALRKTIEGLRSDLRHFSGVTIVDGLARVRR